MLGLNVGIIIGIALIVVGILTITKDDISLIYRIRYKYNFIDENSKHLCAKNLGISVIVMGIGCILLPILGNSGIKYAFWLAIIVIALGYILLMRAIRQINKNIF